MRSDDIGFVVFCMWLFVCLFCQNQGPYLVKSLLFSFGVEMCKMPDAEH